MNFRNSTEKLEEISEPQCTMSYHRGGQAGAVAVSYSTSPMAPHSPSRRYSSGTSGGGTTTSALGSSTSKYSSYRSTGSSSILDRPTSFYTSSSNSGLRSNYISSEYRRSYCAPGSFYSSASTGTSVRRNYSSEYSRSTCSPARSVSSSTYGETGSSSGAALTTTIVNGTSSSGGGRYISPTSSASVNSSTTSRERGSVDAAAAAADIISRYSPAGYVPSIQRQQQTSSGNAHHWRHRSTSSSLNELFGGDEREVERKDLRLESSLSSSSSSSSVATGAAGLWSKPSKRRPSTNSTVLTTVGHTRTDGAVSLAEDKVTGRQEENGITTNDEVTRGIDDVTSIVFLQRNRVSDIPEDGEEENNASNSMDENCFGGTINNVAGRPSVTHGDDPSIPSTSRRTDQPGLFSCATGNSLTSSPTNPSTAHQSIYRGINEQYEGSPTNRSARSRLQALRDERCGLNGLRNIGNTCFMNSVIQCLSNTRPLLEYLLNEQYLADINTTTSSMKGALIKAFSQVIHELWEVGGDHVVNTTALKSQIQRFAPRFMGYSQQDAQEFLRYLLEGLHEDVNRVTTKLPPIHGDIPDSYTDMQKAVESWKRYLRSEDSTIVDVFVGQLRSSLRCTSCDHVSVTLDPFWDLSLPIPARSGTVKLSQCLEHFTREEVLDGDEKPTCSKCQMRRKCTKSFSIQKFPKILVIHLKRFSPMERFRGKLNVMVDFPLTGLDLSAFAAPRVPGCTYNLYGVANHSGTTYSGHYTAYCKHPYSGEWHEYNDSRVSVVSSRSVVSSEAYVLFYEQQPHSSHL
ncbi:ubiquitin carboxyl-terminal hydrolase 20 isoform X4 [Mycetomoellerius zeteki]|uniref:ubiquitin carboxyl-terminal hydrolase 20 isoform X4 n=1 Tax=Mycetomoellerius zeteki TaxID=64791 RepID=UPI00084EBFDE|nr:PREDICTED: ubiquitin carboxyl-terminal hydrolase 20-like isoform X4 [Trachymyrmex zeteki]